MFAVAVWPFPPSVEVTAVVTLFCVPGAMAATFMKNLHDELAVSVAPVRLTLLDPVVAAMVPPPQVPVNPLGVATSKPAGSISVKPTPLREEPVLGFDRTNVSEVLPLTCTLAAPNAFEIVGGTTLGGGSTPPVEPPPQPEAQERPRIVIAQHERERSCVATFPVSPRE